MAQAPHPTHPQNFPDLTPLANSLIAIMSRFTVLHFLALIVLLCTCGLAPFESSGGLYAQQSFEQNPQTFSVNRLPAHATLYHYESEAMAQTGGRLTGRTPLNGTWSFRFLPNSLGKSDAMPVVKSDDFTSIQVPGNWEMPSG